jgi:hypothetical protein
MIDWVQTLVNDGFLLWVFQAALLALLLYAELRDRGWLNKPTGAHVVVERGETSWNILGFAFGIASAVVFQIVSNGSTTLKVLLSMLDAIVLVRLFFFNGWFRNKTIGFVGRARSLQEGLRAMPKPAAPEQTEGPHG